MSGTRVIFLVTRREVVERLRTKSFRIFTIAILLLTGAGIVAAEQAPELLGDSAFHIGLVSPVEGIEAAIQDNAALQTRDFKLRVFDNRAEAEAALTAGKLHAVLDGKELIFDQEERETISTVVNLAIYQLELPDILRNLGLTAREASLLFEPRLSDVEVLNPPEDKEESESRRGLAAIAAIGLYGTLVLYGNWILTGVVEEKSSRVVEVLLGLVQPYALLAGKTLGILIVALIQLSAAIAGALAGLLLIDSTSVLPDAASDLVLAGGVFLILGIVLYSLMFAVVGSTVSRQSEAQSAALPVTLLLVVPYLLSLTYVPDQPDSLVSRLLSLLPITSPLIMPTRVALGAPDAAELAGAILLLAISIVGVAWLGGRVYAGAIITNRHVGLAQMLRLVGMGRKPA